MYQRGCKLLFLGAVASLYSAAALGTTYNLKENPNCSLAEAVEAVTWQRPVGACEAGTGSDRILLEQNKTYSLDAQLLVGGGTKTVKEKVEGEEGEESIEKDVIKPINNITMRIEVAAEPGQRNEEKELATIKANAKDRVLWIHSGATVILEHVRLEGGDVTGKPLEVEWREHAAFEDGDDPTYSLIRFSEAPFGGVAFVEGTLTTRTEVETEGGTARKGGAIYANGASIGLEQIKLLNAEAVGGEGVEVIHCLEETQLSNEPSSCGERFLALPDKWADYQQEYEEIVSGGAIHLQKARLNLTQAWFENNQAEYGGAIATDPLYDGPLEVSGAYFAHNKARQKGGAIFFAESKRNLRAAMVNTLMHDNHAAEGGAALHFSSLEKSSDFVLNNITIFQNTVEGDGAGVWFEEPITGGAFLNSIVLANESGAYKRANKSDFKEAVVTGSWRVNDSQPEYHYEFEQIKDGSKQYELDQDLRDESGESWFRLEDSLDYVGREGKEWHFLADLLREGIADTWFTAWSNELPTLGSALKITTAKNDSSFTVSKGAKKLFDLQKINDQLPAEVVAGDGVDLDQIHVFAKGSDPVNLETAIQFEYEISLETITLGDLKVKYLNSEDKLVWVNGSIELEDQLYESYDLDENGRILKNTVPQYLTAERTLVSEKVPDGSERAINNINEISYINAFLENSHPDMPKRSYLWHGNVEHEGVSSLSIAEQRALLRGKPRDEGSSSKTQGCEEDCKPVEWEGLPYFSVNFEEVNQFSLLASGAPYVLEPQLGGVTVCESKDMRGFTRQDHCDAGAVDFLRALGETDTFEIVVGGQGIFDVLKNDLGDSDVDCRRLPGKGFDFDLEDPSTYITCLEIINPSTRLGVSTSIVIDDNGYPKVRYDSGEGFHGHDYFQYRVKKEAFPEDTTLGGSDIGARVAVVSEPSSGIQSKSLNQVGSAYFAWLLGLLGLGALRRVKASRYLVAGLIGLLAFSTANAEPVKVSDQKLIEKGLDYPRDVCTLRAAIASTDAPPTNTACSQGTGGSSRDIIELPEGEIILWDVLKVNQNNSLEIRGKGPDKTTIKMRVAKEDEPEVCARLFETQSALTLSNLTLEGGCVIADTQERGGGALYAYGVNTPSSQGTPPSVGLRNVVVKNNNAMGANGGAVFLAYRGDNSAEASFDSVHFENNSAENASAIYVDAADPSSRNNIFIMNSVFSEHSENDSSVISLASGKNARLHVVNSLFFENDSIAVDLTNHAGTTNIVNSTFLKNEYAFKFEVEPVRFAIHNSIVADKVDGAINGTRNLQANFNLLRTDLECNVGDFCARKSDNNDFIDKDDIHKLHDASLTVCAKDDQNECKEQNRWFAPYLAVSENHAVLPNNTCTVTVTSEDEDGGLIEEDRDVHCILERGNPGPVQTGINSPANCRTTDMRGKTREAGGNCDRGAYEKQINTAMPDIGNNANRRSRTALLNVLRNDIAGDHSSGAEMLLRPGTLKTYSIEDHQFEYRDEAEIPVLVEKEAIEADLKKHFGDKNEKLTKFLETGNTLGKLHVVRSVWDYKGKYKKPVPQYYDDITIIDADGQEVEQSSQVLNVNHKDYNPELLCVDSDGVVAVDADEECLVFYEAPKTYLCADLPFEDYFAYSIEAWKVDSWEKPESSEGLPENESEDNVPVFDESERETFTGYVQVTIANIPPIVPYEGITYRINPGDKVVVKLKEKGVKAIEGGVSDEIPIKLEKLVLDKEPQFALRNGRTHEVLGTGLLLDSENMTVTYRHADASKTFADTFSVKVTDSCGASSIVPIRIEFHGAEQAGGSTPWAMTFLLVVVGVARRKLLAKAS